MARRSRAAGFAGGLALALATSACATIAAGRDSAPERRLADSPDAEIAALAVVPVFDDPLLTEYLAGVVDRLASVPEREVAMPPLTVVVLQDPTIAAFAMPGPRIYVHSGLLAAVANEAQLAAMLAREIAHVRRGHVDVVPADVAAAIDAAIAGIGPSIAGAMTRGEDGPMISPVGAAILGGRLGRAYTGAWTGHGVAAEHEADAEAVERLSRARYDPHEAVVAFERLHRAAAQGGAAERFVAAREAAVAARVASLTRLLDPARVPAAPADSTEPAANGSAGAFTAALVPLVRENARLEMRAGRWRAARTQLDRVLAVDPNDARAHLYDGDLHRLRAQRARSVADRDELARLALARYQRGAALDPRLAEVSRQIGLLYYQQGRHEQARAAFEEYLARRPDAPDAARVAEYVLTLTR